MNETAIFSIASKNYLAFARTLFDSVKRLHGGTVDCHLLLADEVDGAFDANSEGFAVTEARALGISGFTRMAFSYDILEFNTSLKPFFVKHLLSREYKKVIYLDPDILVYRSLGFVFELLDDHRIILTPHATTPAPSGDPAPSRDGLFLTSGVFNLGFLAVSESEETLAFLDWWSSRLVRECQREVGKGLFADQKWLDLAPCYCESMHILRHKGCNMAWWNFRERTLDGSLRVNGTEPLIFFHFSGLDLGDANGISKHKHGYTLDTRADLSEIFEDYVRKVLDSGHEKTSGLPYKYGSYDNGVRIGSVARRLYPYVAERYPNPFAVGRGSYYELLGKKGLLESAREAKYSKAFVASRAKYVNAALKLTLRLLGVDRYDALMKYLWKAAMLRNQGFLVES